MTCPKPYKLPSLDSCQKIYSCRPTKKVILFDTQNFVDLVFHAGDAEKFPKALDLKSLDLVLGVSEQSPHLTTKEEDGNKRLVQLEPACKADDNSPNPG